MASWVPFPGRGGEVLGRNDGVVGAHVRIQRIRVGTRERERSRGCRLWDDVKLMQPKKILSLSLSLPCKQNFVIVIEDAHPQTQMVTNLFI